jgi:hypothetical protein
MKARTIATLGAAFAAGLFAGWLDVGTTEVQGPLLVLMLGAFVVALLSHAPAWGIAAATTVALPIAHLIAHAMSGARGPTAGMLIALLPALLAAYGGRSVALLIDRSSRTLAPASVEDGPWHTRSASPFMLLSCALGACAIVGVGPVYATLVARGQPFAWWVTTWWQIVFFLAWAVATPSVLRIWRSAHHVDEQGVTPAELATHAVVVATIGVSHALIMPLLTSMLLVPLGPNGLARAWGWAAAAYVPLDALAYTLVVGLGYASNATRRTRAAHVREAR